MWHSLYKRLGAALPLCALLLTAPQVSAWGRILPEHFGRYNLPPSRFGYPLDDYSAGYYGGGRYREYYSYGRGFGVVDFPSALPHDPYNGWLPRGIPLGKYAHTPVNQAPPLPVGLPTNSHLILEVPPQADVWLEGQKMAQTGEQRVFISPPLTRGQNYHYQVKVRWLEQGQEKNETRTVAVQAGQHITARFPDVERTQPAALPTLQPVSGVK